MCLAVPGKVLSITEGDALRRAGKVSFGGVVKEVNLAYVPEAQVGDYVVVHVGFALSVVDEEEARRTLDYYRQIGELAGLEEASGEPGPAPGNEETGPPETGAGKRPAE